MLRIFQKLRFWQAVSLLLDIDGLAKIRRKASGLPQNQRFCGKKEEPTMGEAFPRRGKRAMGSSDDAAAK